MGLVSSGLACARKRVRADCAARVRASVLGEGEQESEQGNQVSGYSEQPAAECRPSAYVRFEPRLHKA